jgi:hypothetical protein
MKTYRSVEVYLHSFLTSVLNREKVASLPHSPAALTPTRSSRYHWTGGNVGFEKEKSSLFLGIEPQSILYHLA